MFPNDYEKVVKRQREERQRQRELERQKEIEEREKGAKTDMKQVGLQGDQIQILMKMKIMSERGGKEVWAVLPLPHPLLW